MNWKIDKLQVHVSTPSHLSLYSMHSMCQTINTLRSRDEKLSFVCFCFHHYQRSLRWEGNTRFISFSHWTARAKGREKSEKRKENDKKFTKWVESMLVGCRTMLNPHNHASILRLSESKIPPHWRTAQKRQRESRAFTKFIFPLVSFDDCTYIIAASEMKWSQ